MMRAFAATLMLCLTMCACPARATVVGYTATGTVTSVSGFGSSPFSLGQSYVVNFSVNDAVPSSGFTGRGIYNGALVSYTLDVGNGAYTASGSGMVEVRNAPAFGGLDMFLAVANNAGVPTVDGRSAANFELVGLFDTTTTVFSTESIPAILPPLSSFNSVFFRLFYSGGAQVFGNLTSLTAVPECSPMLLGSLIAAVAGWWKVRSR